jgi:lysophospholipid acyltransferase (LPLAT)-like uncharacterized protein
MTTEQATAPKRKRRKWTRRVRNWIVGILGPIILRLWMGSLRVRFVGTDRIDGKVAKGSIPGIYVFWHQNAVILTGCYRDSGFCVLVSQHGDGEMVARILKGLGMSTVRGSSTRGGARATREILRESDQGVDFAITPDGPKGPRHVFQEGAIFLGSRTGLPIYPVAVCTKRHVKLPTWDGMVLPLPFTATLIRMSPGIPIPKDLDRDGIEPYRQAAEKQLRELTESTEKDFEALYHGAKST